VFAPSASAPAPVAALADSTLAYNVTFQKHGPQKVRKTHDGTLHFDDTGGGRVTLLDSDGAHVARSQTKKSVFVSGDTLEVGHNDVEIVDAVAAVGAAARAPSAAAAPAPAHVCAATSTFKAPVRRPPRAPEPDADDDELLDEAAARPAPARLGIGGGMSGSVSGGGGVTVNALSRPVLGAGARPMLGVGSSSALAPDAFVLQQVGEGGGSTAVVLDSRLASFMRPHQLAGVLFLWRAINGLTGSGGAGAILADDMGLGKTLQVIALIFTALKQSARPGGGALLKKVVVCVPSSLVGNWRAEIKKWLGDERCRPIAITQLGKDAEIKIKDFTLGASTVSPVLLISYEMLRKYVALLTMPAAGAAVGLLICDEGHRLKNTAGNQTTDALALLPTPRRVLLTGTPLQNDLDEFYGLANFVVPRVLGSLSAFRRDYTGPISAGRDRGASASSVALAGLRAAALATLSKSFLLRRTAEVLDKFLPRKSESIVFCRLSPLQTRMYDLLVASYKRAARDGTGSGVDSLVLLNALRKICAHPDLLLLAPTPEVDTVDEAQPEGNDSDDNETDESSIAGAGAGSAGRKRVRTRVSVKSSTASTSFSFPDFSSLAPAGYRIGVLSLPPSSGATTRAGAGAGAAFRATARGVVAPSADEIAVAIAASSKLAVLDAILSATRALAPTDRVVIVSSFGMTLDLVGGLCAARGLSTLRLDGSTSSAERSALVSAFNAPDSTIFALLLSAAAGGAGLNLIGANVLVLVDLSWNPAIDIQALARVWRDGQKKHTYIYRLVSAFSLEEKVFQRQLLKGDMSTAIGFDSGAGGASSEASTSSFSRAELQSLFDMDTTGGAGADGATPLDCDTVKTLGGRGTRKTEGAGGGAGECDAPERSLGSRPRLTDPWPAYAGPSTLADARLARAASGTRLGSYDAVSFVRTLEYNTASRI
jgi:SNF2 family DNA or RNA helicase